MLYKKNGSKKLDTKLFENPTCEYRGAPFWAWNTKLEKDELLWQIDRLKEMGLGGYHMHTRSGMNTEYLGTEFMDLIKACNEHGKKVGMLSWLYDEDRWPSGAAGGIVTKNPKYRSKFINFTMKKKEDVVDAKTGYETGKPYFVSAYDVTLNPDGTLKSYAVIGENDEAQGKKWYAYVCTPVPTGWYNYQTYVDTLDKEAMQEFIRVTYEAYDKAVGDDFGESIPAIFTDEPQFAIKHTFSFATSEEDVSIPWTTTADDSFKSRYGYSLVSKLPEVFWDLPNGEPSLPRYHYNDHICELFTQAFSDQCGKWCEDHGIALTGHMLHEESLNSQTNAIGEAMRCYRSFALPGIDMLCDHIELTTAKQCQSAVHQYGREAMLSELYGVTGWAFDFRGHKFQGDWQAALGVTIRVQHLSWVSMKGSAKRDYPASIHYQSCWYDKYPYVEDHYARLNTALTRGVPDVKVGVIHPIESYWLNYGPSENTAGVRNTMEENFQKLINVLLRGTIDFDFISESLLPDQNGGVSDKKLNVGVMNYSAVVVPPIETIRKTTVDVLLDFIKKGGKVVFTGDCPRCVDGQLSSYAKDLYDKAEKVPFTQTEILNSLADYRDVDLKDFAGRRTNKFIYNMRNDGGRKWLFIAHVDKTPHKSEYSSLCDGLHVTVTGCYRPTVYDTITGETHQIAYKVENGYTTFDKVLFASDSLLVYLEPAKEGDKLEFEEVKRGEPDKIIDIKQKVDYTISEPNVLVLDMCRWSWDKKEWKDKEEILRIDAKIRKEFNYPLADGHDIQPWAIEEEKPDKFPYLRFEFDSEVESTCKLAFEEAVEVEFNGQPVEINPDGYYVDKSIKTIAMPNVKVGTNELIVRVPISKRVSIENMFLLGDFGVRVNGAIATVVARQDKIAFGSITQYGMPFYGAQIAYEVPIETGDCDLTINASLYEGALVDVKLDGKEVGKIVYAPYEIDVKDVSAGKHTLTFTLYATRVNSFGALHDCLYLGWKGPNMYYTDGDLWSYEYMLTNQGIMKSPVIKVYNK
ncbi:MAG: hypothetical protein IJX06_05125 [Clostridia bacterium]|nr:hypothetical protein [Clostridia bacterium]